MFHGLPAILENHIPLAYSLEFYSEGREYTCDVSATRLYGQ